MSTEVKDKIRKVFIEDLPRRKNNMNWALSVGHIVKGVYDNIKFEVEIVDYKNGYLYIKYLNKPIFKIGTIGFLNCKFGKLLGLKTSEFKIEIGTIFKDSKRDVTITYREYRKDKNERSWKWYKYTCNKCGWTEGWIVESALLGQVVGCGCCSGQKIVLGINTMWDKARWMCDLGVSEEDAKTHTPQSMKNIFVLCPDCGKVKDKPIAVNNLYRTHSIACTCSDKISYPNKLAYSLLDQLNKIYGLEYLEHEYSPSWIGRRAYDNYFIYNGKEYILEMDGLWHKVDNKMSGQAKEESKCIDDEKDKLAKEHNIEVIRVDCDKSELEFIKQNILNSKLNELFDLNQIDWNEVEKYTLSNLVKIACDYKKNNPDITTTEIGIIIKLDRHTIRNYLKKGTELGWCSYNPQDEKSNNIKRNNKFKFKPISIFKDGIWLKNFKSIMECETVSEELFKTKLDNRNISAVLKGKRKYHKGFTFQYI